MDNRSPNTILNNGRQRAAEISSFIDGFAKIAKPLVDDYFTKQANRQVGELLQQYDPVDLMRSADPQQQQLVRQISPQARDILQDKAAQSAALDYTERLAVERSSRRALLQGPDVSDEVRAQVEAEAKNKALEDSGLRTIPPSYQLKYSGPIMQVEAQLRGIDYKGGLAEREKAARSQYTNGIDAGLRNLTDQFRVLKSQSPDAATMDRAIGLIKKGIEDQLNSDSAVYLPSDQAQAWGEALQSRISTYVAADRYDDALALTQMLRVLSAADIKTPTGAPFFKEKLQNGLTFGDLVSSLEEKLQTGYRQFQERQVLEANADVIRGALMGDPNAEVAAQQALSDPRLTAAQLMTLGSTVNQATSIGSRPTQQQLLTEAELRYQIAQGDFQPEAMWQQVQASNLKPQQVLGLAGIIQNGAEEPTKLTAYSRAYAADEVTAAGAVIAEALGTNDRGTVETITRDLNNAASKMAEKRIQEMQAAGQKVDSQTAVDIFRNELNAVRNTRLKEVRAGEQAYQDTPDKRVAGELQEFAQNVAASGGKVDVMTFPKQVRVDFQSAYPGKAMTAPALEKYMMNRMNQIKDGDKPVYANPQKTLQGIIQKERDKADPGAAAIRKGVPAGYEMYGNILNGINSFFGGGKPQQPSPKPSSGSDSKPSPTGPQSNAKPESPNLLAMTLETVANVLAPPAAAAERPAGLQNAEAVATLTKIWAQREPLQMQTRPLPQVPGNAPTGAVPLAINHDKHPIFVAIGIAEGTRTPSGGYTRAYSGHRDPGDGHWNRGTVSGGRGSGASPQQVDRQWMARLTQQAMNVQGQLRAAGFQPGTQAWNRAMFNVLDLTVQAPAAVGDLLRKLPGVARAGATVEAFAKARADSFINPRTGRLDTSFRSYGALFNDQRSRAGVWDYRRRL